MRLACHEATPVAATSAGSHARRMTTGSFAHGDLLSVIVDVRLASCPRQARRSLERPLPARHDCGAPLAPSLRQLAWTSFWVDTGVRREAARLFDLTTLGAHKTAVDEGALLRIVVGALNQALPHAGRHRFRVSSTVGRGGVLRRKVGASRYRIARSRDGQAARNGSSCIGREQKVDARRRVSNVRRIVRVRAARDACTFSRDGCEARRWRCRRSNTRLSRRRA